MAEGEDLIDFDEDHDNDDEEEEVNRTWAFQPGAVSTPRGGWGQYEMQPMNEKSGLPYTSYEEPPLLGAQAQMQNSWDSLTRLFPRASATDLETSYSKTGRLQVKMSGWGKKTYPLFTKDRNTGKEHLNPNLTKEIKKSLGSSAGDIIAEDQTDIDDSRKKMAQYEEQQRQHEALVAEKEKKEQEVQNLSLQLERLQTQINSFQDEHGSFLENQSEVNRLDLLKKNYESEVKKKEKELADLNKLSNKNKSVIDQIDKIKQDLKSLIQKIGKTDESIKTKQEEYGKSLQYGTELEGLKQEKQALELQFKKAKKESAEISKQTKDPEKVKNPFLLKKKKLKN